MAVLSKIRQRSFFLIVIIALALFSFVLADVIKNGSFGSDSSNVGSVDGTDIVAQQFMQKVAQVEKQSQQQGQNMSSTQAMNSVWEQEVRSVLVGKEIEKIGLGIGNEQVINVVKTNPYFSQNPQFLNDAGKFDENKFKEFVKSIKNDPNQDRWVQWKQFEEDVAKSAVEQLYYNMIKGGVYTTKAEGKFKHELDNKKIDFDYVTVGFSTINDDQVKVSDDEIMAYMKKNPKKYKSDDTRTIDYVFIENKPSEQDEKDLETKFYGYVNGVANGKDSIPSFKDVKNENVIAFVNKESEIPFDSTYVTKKDLPIDSQEQLFNLSTGEVFGPYVNNEYQSLSRLMGRKSNASAKASHILLAYEGAQNSSATRTKEEAQALANSLMAQAKSNPANFAMLASTNSDDPGSKNNGGEYDNITPGQMVPTFNDFVFNNPVGAIGVVETDYGFHVIKVSAKYDAVQLATISQKIEPSSTTIDAIYNKASKFEADANEKSFEEVAKASKLTIVPASNIKPSDEFIQGLGAQREIVRWSFNEDTEIGTIKRFETPKGYVIATLKSKNDSGLLAMDVAKESVGVILRNEKKAELIKKKMSGSSLEDVAKVSGGSVLSATNVSLGTPVIQNVGSESKVVGTAFSLAEGKTSKLIVGNTGVFMVKAKKVVAAPAVDNFTSFITQEKSQQASSSQIRAYQAIKEKSKIKDNRANF
ncbi:peptidylprolyl isomerase [Flavobacterium sp. 316]|uniref:Periplasmic chaperone PpiD n=1 Tax=Flavobacterium sediminilitoris TaxID=2024526 RepID=A0ABY4HR43_9FLAO|nr:MULTISPECIES: peptidylprolyl isomerase [Flavobacterium]KIX20991.1 peptidylprolyl isomerase [Flavobacterium sp. 316]UOX35340.1 peptidylprolyl isomerase [Flavobacterium sediminilitoris]